MNSARVLLALGCAAAIAPSAAADSFRYDPLGRLIEVTAANGAQRSYAYDGADNFRSVATGAAVPSQSGTTWATPAAGSGWSLSSDRLTATYDGFGGAGLAAATGVSAGEHEFSVVLRNPRTPQVGITRLSSGSQDLGSSADSVAMRQDGRVYGDGFQMYADLGTPADGDVITVHLKDGGVWFRRNGGAWNPGSGVPNADPATGVGGIAAPQLSSMNPALRPAIYAENDGPGNAPPASFAASFAAWAAAQNPAATGGAWDAARLQSGWTLTDSAATASFDGFGGSSVLGGPGYSSGDREFSVIVHDPRTTQIGLTRLETNPAGSDVGGSADSIGMRQDGRIYGDGFQLYADFGSPPAEGDTITVRLRNGQVWFRRNGGPWNPGGAVQNADPAADRGGLPAPTLTAAHPRVYPVAYAENDGPGGAPAVRYEGRFAGW